MSAGPSQNISTAGPGHQKWNKKKHQAQQQWGDERGWCLWHVRGAGMAHPRQSPEINLKHPPGQGPDSQALTQATAAV